MKAGVLTLSSIELSGFKSFAKRTKIEFGQGLVAIVGPNGSGKSNIADAVRWVLGEQKNKSLRSDKSEDLIYHGGDGKARASMAEVTLRLDNSSGKIPVELNEIEISRRLYRSGESSYLLNGRRCSLSSIQELLSKAGFGVGSYTVVGQGMIEKLILSSAHERKQLFEEASGIKQHEIKLSQTNQRLLATKENLGQINSLINELKPRWEELQRQQGFVSRRVELENELASKQLAYLAHNTTSVEKEQAQSQARLTELENELSKKNLLLEELEKTRNESKKTGMTDAKTLEKQLQQLDQKRTKLEESIASVNASIQVLESSQQSEITISRIKQEIQNAETSIKEHLKNQKSLKKVVDSFAIKINAFDEKISVQTKLLDKTRRDLKRSQKTEYLSHCLGLIDILQDSITKKRSYADLGIIFYKLRRMIKHSIADNSTDLALQVGRIQNSISSLLGEKDKLADSQTKEVIKLRASELDTHSIAAHIKDLKSQLGKAQNHSSAKDAQQIVKLRSQAEKLESEKQQLIDSSDQKRNELVEIAQLGQDDGRDEYYIEHEKLSGDMVGLSQLISQTKDALAKAAEQIRYSEGLRSQWFGKKPAKVKAYAGMVELGDLERLNAELGLISQINPEVTDASKELNERMDFLLKQQRDLGKALVDLEQIAQRTEQGMRQVFEKSFAKINSNFSRSFTKLFGGGDANLSLNTQKDGYGIEIEVRLPSKKSQNLSSLSGGEKALASVALLAAILQTNPSPFVVLDEVDAALDEANTLKFAAMIAEITKHSQVLVITHNHDTMAAASELLGVTTTGNNDSHIIRVQLDSLPVGAVR